MQTDPFLHSLSTKWFFPYKGLNFPNCSNTHLLHTHRQVERVKRWHTKAHVWLNLIQSFEITRSLRLWCRLITSTRNAILSWTNEPELETTLGATDHVRMQTIPNAGALQCSRSSMTYSVQRLCMQHGHELSVKRTRTYKKKSILQLTFNCVLKM